MSRTFSSTPSDGVAAEGSESPLVQAFEALSQSFPDGEDLTTVLRCVTGVATATVRGCDEASLSILDARGRMSTAAATSDVLVALDKTQYETGEGPCVSVLRGDPLSVSSDELAADGRWPRFGREAAAQGFRSAFSRRFDAGQLVGSVNLYARKANAFGEDDKATAATLAAFAGVVTALSYERIEVTHLREALLSRDVIGQAKGILMEREKMTPDEAFDVLRKTSQNVNRKLRDLAETLALTGELPTEK